ncbi:hypothetical protein F5B20DRAFT_564389 [Whalleya microplaca]|nr:hypothetical protein F5B20DRAFT_564389 [Whalleya microplaca]
MEVYYACTCQACSRSIILHSVAMPKCQTLSDNPDAKHGSIHESHLLTAHFQSNALRHLHVLVCVCAPMPILFFFFFPFPAALFPPAPTPDLLSLQQISKTRYFSNNHPLHRHIINHEAFFCAFLPRQGLSNEIACSKAAKCELHFLRGVARDGSAGDPYARWSGHADVAESRTS